MPRSLSILVVDDFVDGREMLSDYLRFCGFHVVEATSGAEALVIARDLKPAVVLMDLAMPGIDGWEATRRLKADARTRHITVIAVTAHALAGDEAYARSAGCDGYIAKPYDLVEVADLVRRVMREGAGVLATRTPTRAPKGRASGKQKGPSKTPARPPRRRR